MRREGKRKSKAAYGRHAESGAILFTFLPLVFIIIIVIIIIVMLSIAKGQKDHNFHKSVINEQQNSRLTLIALMSS